MQKLPKNPLVEALCEFQFEVESGSNPIVPSKFYEIAAEEFPEVIQVNDLVAEDPASVGGPTIRTRLQFRNPNQPLIIQVWGDMLAVNHLRPYSSWEKFRGIILHWFTEFNGIARPRRIKRIGLRYINHVRIPSTKVTIADYFRYGPKPLTASANPVMKTFNCSSEYDFASEGRLRLQLATMQPSQEETTKFLLDLDFFALDWGVLTPENLGPKLNAAHGRIEEVFQSVVSDNLMKEFGDAAID